MVAFQHLRKKTIWHTKSVVTLDKLFGVRKEKQDIKDDLIKQLHSVNAIITKLELSIV